jgi:hypothetical protein
MCALEPIPLTTSFFRADDIAEHTDLVDLVIELPTHMVHGAVTFQCTTTAAALPRALQIFKPPTEGTRA